MRDFDYSGSIFRGKGKETGTIVTYCSISAICILESNVPSVCNCGYFCGLRMAILVVLYSCDYNYTNCSYRGEDNQKEVVVSWYSSCVGFRILLFTTRRRKELDFWTNFKFTEMVLCTDSYKYVIFLGLYTA